MDQKNNEQVLISAIVPAFNEEKTIEQIVEVLAQHALIDEVVVIDDGSADQTALRAKSAGAQVFSLYPNQGKGQAMTEGVKRARHEIICFFDGDVKGLTRNIVMQVIAPVMSGRYAMFVAIRDRKIYWVNKLLHFSPILGGERVLSKDLWTQVPEKYKRNFQIEIALNYYAKRNQKKMGFALMPGLTQVIKEKKRGLITGAYQRILMMGDVILTVLQLYVWEGCRRAGKKLCRAWQ